jgi:DNA-directed RNA polymerase subunit RPC12/RpoP
MTINHPADRLRSINDMWSQFKGTCQICGGRRLINIRDGVMPKHKTSGAHNISGNCSGSLKPPLERDFSLAESYLVDLKQRKSRSTGTEKGSLTRMINNLEKRIEIYRHLEPPVGIWQFGVAFYTENAEAVEFLAHKILDERLDKQAPFGEVYCCSLSEATEAVEHALWQLGLLDSTRKETQSPSDHTLNRELPEYQDPERKPAKYECTICHSQWEGVEPGNNPCPKCRTHLFTKFLAYV